MNKFKISLFFLLLTVSVYLTGLFTDLRFSDEIFHFQYAQDWLEQGKRPIYNKLVDTIEEYGYYRYYINGPLSQYGLVFLWKLFGGISKNIAQLYQASIYLLLLIFTYLLSKELYDKKIAFYAAIIVGTIPLFIAFSILFFEEVPITMLTVLCLFLLVKKRIWMAAIVTGLMFLTKRNAYLLFPAFALLCFGWKRFYEASFKKRALNLSLFCLITLLVMVPDFKWRYKNFGGLIVPQDKGDVVAVIVKGINNSLLPIKDLFKKTEVAEKKLEVAFKNYLPESILSPVNLPKYLGVIFSFLFLFYLLNIKKFFQTVDLILWIPIIVYIPLMFIFFKGWWSYRYLAPILPFMITLLSKILIKWSKKFIVFILILCFLQFFSTLVYVGKQRRISISEKQTLEFVRKQMPENSRLLTPEGLFVSYYTGRPTVWSNSFLYYPLPFSDFFWTNNTLRIMLDMQIKYLVIEKDRIYDDSKVRHFGGWPKSFVDRLYSLSFLEKVFENEAISVWKVRL